jgi:hypothetical protein
MTARARAAPSQMKQAHRDAEITPYISGRTLMAMIGTKLRQLAERRPTFCMHWGNEWEGFSDDTRPSVDDRGVARRRLDGMEHLGQPRRAFHSPRSNRSMGNAAPLKRASAGAVSFT